MVMINLFLIYWLCSQQSLAIRAPAANRFSYSFMKPPNKKTVDPGKNPVYLLISPKEGSSGSVAPPGVSEIKNNNTDEVLGGLKDGSYAAEPTLLDFHMDVNLVDKVAKADSKVGESVLKLAAMTFLADRVLVPVDYEALLEKGCCGLKELRVVALALVSLITQTSTCPKIHFVVYNYDPPPGGPLMGSYVAEYSERHKLEIEEALNAFMSSFVYQPDSSKLSPSHRTAFNADCTYVPKYSDIAKFVKTLYEEDEKYFSTCSSEIEAEFRNKLGVAETLKKSLKTLSKHGQGWVDISEFDRVVSHSHLYSSIMQKNREFTTGFLERFYATIGDNLNVALIKDEIDQLVINTLKRYNESVTLLKTGGDEYSAKILSHMKKVFLDDLKSKLTQINEGIIMTLMEDLYTKFTAELKKIRDFERLDDVLAGLISKFDSEYCSVVKNLNYNLLKDHKLYEGLVKAKRERLVSTLKDQCNSVMEAAIRSGMYYHKFSILDGIRLFPNQKLMNLVRKLFGRFYVPLRINFMYLSPNAFGLSNLFGSDPAFSLDRRWFFTGKDKEG